MLLMSRKISGHQFIAIIFFIKALGVFYATLVFGRYTPLVDAQEYLSGGFIGSGHYRTALVQQFAVLTGSLFGEYLTHLIFGLISTAGLIYYYLTGGRRWWLLLTLFGPSAFVWASIVGKEAIYIGFSGILLVLWSSYVVNNLRWYEIVLCVFSFLICFSLRPHYALALAWLYIATLVIKRLKEKAPVFLILLFVAGALSLFFLRISEVTVWDDLLFRGYTAIDPSARASRFESLGITPHAEPHHYGFSVFKEQIPLGMLAGIVGPLPSEVLNRIEFLPFFIEGVIILISPLCIFVWARVGASQLDPLFKRVFWWGLIPAILIVIAVHAPFGLLNPGSATRWRTNFEQIFYLAPLLLVLRFHDRVSE